MEQRKYPRHVCNIDAVLAVTGTDTYRCVISEYSQGGLQLSFAGADGAAIARQLASRGYAVRLRSAFSRAASRCICRST